MASIIHKMKKGRPYYYAVQSARVNGKPRIVRQKYLGTVEGIVARTEGSKPPKPKEAVLFEAGGVAALLRIAQRLELLEVINAAVPKRDQGPGVGHYIVLAALNRALAPCSKLAIGDWYEQTVLRRLWGFDKTVFSAQRFWDHMSLVSDAAIEAIQEALVPRIRREFGLDAEVLLYDTTNFFTFLSTVNDRCTLAQRIVHPVVRGAAQAQPLPGHVAARQRRGVPVVHAHVAVHVEIPRLLGVLRHPGPGEFLHPRIGIAGAGHRGDLRPQRPHLRHAVEPDHLSEFTRRDVPQPLRTAYPSQRHESQDQQNVQTTMILS